MLRIKTAYRRDISTHMKNNIPTGQSQSQGFALPLIIMVGMMMMVGGFAMMARTFGAFRGSLRTTQFNQAQEIAERGISEVTNQLNSDYRYLWVNCYRKTAGTHYASGND